MRIRGERIRNSEYRSLIGGLLTCKWGLWRFIAYQGHAWVVRRYDFSLMSAALRVQNFERFRYVVVCEFIRRRCRTGLTKFSRFAPLPTCIIIFLLGVLFCFFATHLFESVDNFRCSREVGD